MQKVYFLKKFFKGIYYLAYFLLNEFGMNDDILHEWYKLLTTYTWKQMPASCPFDCLHYTRYMFTLHHGSFGKIQNNKMYTFETKRYDKT